MISLTSVSNVIAVNQLRAITERLDTINRTFGTGIVFSQTFQGNTSIVVSTTVTINGLSEDIASVSYTTSNGMLSTSITSTFGSGSDTEVDASYSETSAPSVARKELNKTISALSEVISDLGAVQGSLPSLATNISTIVDLVSDAKSTLSSVNCSSSISLVPIHSTLLMATTDLSRLVPRDNLQVAAELLIAASNNFIAANVQVATTHLSSIATDVHTLVTNTDGMGADIHSMSTSLGSYATDLHSIAVDVNALKSRGVNTGLGK